MPDRPLVLVSFGFLHLRTDAHGRPVLPEADRIEDVRKRLRDPAAARELLDNLTDYAALPAGPRRIAVGCAGGRHRACALIELLAQRVADRGIAAMTLHLHAHLPRVLKN
ncbi:hypothetical protein [Streptomyces sp. NPDC093223]|uniref:RapZ C-terminal domain-containing protein n=1 Tax=Streptomyces sp. NPDC093223 TaxID=3366033 RepID=UPI0038219662